MISDIIINQNTPKEDISLNTQETIIINSTTNSSSINVEQSQSLVNILNQNNLVETPVIEKIEIELNTHNKLYNFLLGELTLLKNNLVEKDSLILNLQQQIEELNNKLNKKSSVDILLKLKENLINKHSELNNEMSNNLQKEEIKEDSNNLHVQINDKNTNVKIGDDFISLKPKKKPSVLRRGF
jgi:hypothetical protein